MDKHRPKIATIKLRMSYEQYLVVKQQLATNVSMVKQLDKQAWAKFQELIDRDNTQQLAWKILDDARKDPEARCIHERWQVALSEARKKTVEAQITEHHLDNSYGDELADFYNRKLRGAGITTFKTGASGNYLQPIEKPEAKSPEPEQLSLPGQEPTGSDQ